MKQLKAKILVNREIGAGFYRMRINSAYLAKKTRPGQFIEVRPSDGPEPLLRRPLGVHRIVKGGIELLYKVAGKGTGLMARMKAGEELDVIGPLGTGFDIGKEADNARRMAILVAGGMGVAPLVFLSEELGKRRTDMHVLIGGCSKEHVLCEKDFKRSGAKVLVATEDGSRGRKGLVTDLLKDLLRNTNDDLRTTIYACGPTGMLKAVSGIAEDGRVECQVSLEERMACGVGVCLGCPVKVKQLTKYRMVCKDGPVFNAREIAW